MKGLRVAGAGTLPEAYAYLEQEFLPRWNQHLTITPARPPDAHRPLEAEYDLATSLSRVEMRQMENNNTFRWQGKR
ncbi:MAG: hypothetical protein ABFD86_20405 [Bryobacteraceae bacterium]